MLNNKIQLVVFTILVLCIFMLISLKTTSESITDWDAMQFAASGSALKFFDYRSGMIYLYSDVDGKLYEKWVMKKLGEDLEKPTEGQK